MLSQEFIFKELLTEWDEKDPPFQDQYKFRNFFSHHVKVQHYPDHIIVSIRYDKKENKVVIPHKVIGGDTP